VRDQLQPFRRRRRLRGGEERPPILDVQQVLDEFVREPGFLLQQALGEETGQQPARNRADRGYGDQADDREPAAEVDLGTRRN
jgi:hypothetical protein